MGKYFFTFNLVFISDHICMFLLTYSLDCTSLLNESCYVDVGQNSRLHKPWLQVDALPRHFENCSFPLSTTSTLLNWLVICECCLDVWKYYCICRYKRENNVVSENFNRHLYKLDVVRRTFYLYWQLKLQRVWYYYSIYYLIINGILYK